MAAGAVAAARGCLLGLVLGDAVGGAAGLVPDAGALPATSGGQLACFTVDGLIRADVRAALRGPLDPPSAVWRAYRRWAALQGVIDADSAGEPFLDGWLAEVPALAQVRGPAPATIAALRARGDTPVGETPPQTTHGPRAVVRTLPVGMYARAGQAARLAADIAALTHRAEALVAAGYTATAVHLFSEDASLAHTATVAQERAVRLGFGPVPQAFRDALDAAAARPGDARALAGWAAPGTAVGAVAGALYVVASHPERDRIRDAVLFAAAAGDGGHIATIVGALLGAWHGPEALPVDWLSRVELVWVADLLSRDLVRQISQSPAGTDGSTPADPYWWDRYPGW
ncbi:ADP-ribosylglycohydrolase [Pilimelia terevasa]|uniref:ADP-ribosylglycohydrolase n=1 Tax=Pilimelia terevasa TaxID=53372 RepID=A0A8J3BEX8_9ACTN|nr:ADP-ribosylglycohydrolase family protein [Pilimelia terevasa]GGK16865.1 ADP-ribosylglycohydrolase [Pilimelia terevasa]